MKHKRFFRSNRNRQSGFTLIELLVVLVAIGIVASFVARIGGNAISSTRIEQANQEIIDLISTGQRYRDTTGSYTSITVALLKNNGYGLKSYSDGVDENAYGKTSDIDPAGTPAGANALIKYAADSSESCNQLQARVENMPGITTPAPACSAAFVLSFHID